MEMTPSHHGPRSLASPQSLSQVTFPPHVSLISLATRMASSSIADTRGLIQAYFITNLDWYDISNKLRPQYSLDFLGGQFNCLVTHNRKFKVLTDLRLSGQRNYSRK